jgi:hypothetical protein
MSDVTHRICVSILLGNVLHFKYIISAKENKAILCHNLTVLHRPSTETFRRVSTPNLPFSLSITVLEEINFLLNMLLQRFA